MHLPRSHVAREGEQVSGDRIATALAAEQMAGLASPVAAAGGGDVQLRLLKQGFTNWSAPGPRR
jgi:hypothetical protein